MAFPIQAPKLAPYIEEMRANVARVLGVDVSEQVLRKIDIVRKRPPQC